MNTIIAMSSAWGIITIVFAVLLLYRRSLTKKESDWIPLTDDAKEDSAIQAQTIIEMKTRKLTVPIPLSGRYRSSCCWSLWVSCFSTPSLPPRHAAVRRSRELILAELGAATGSRCAFSRYFHASIGVSCASSPFFCPTLRGPIDILTRRCRAFALRVPC